MNTQAQEPPAAARPSVQFQRWLMLAFLMALCFIGHFNRASITSAGDERMMAQFGISPERMGMVYSAFLLVYTVFMIPGGWLIDRRGPAAALAIMGIGSAIFCGFTGLVGFGVIPAAQVWFALIVVRSLMGLLSTPLHPGAARAVGNWFPADRQAFPNGLITGASILAYALVHPIFGGLIDRVDWPTAFVITGTLTALLAGAWLLWAKDHPQNPRVLAQEQRASTKPEPWSSATRRDLVLLTLAYSAVGYFQYLFFYWLHFYFDSVLHMGKAESRYFAGLPNLAMATSMPLGGWLADRIVRWRGDSSAGTLIPKVGMLLSAALLVGAIYAKDRFWIVAFFTASLGFLGLCEASFWSAAVKLGGQRGGTSAAIMNTGGNGIGLLAPMVTPWLGRQLGWEWGLGAGAVIGALGALCWFAIGRPLSSRRSCP